MKTIEKNELTNYLTEFNQNMALMTDVTEIEREQDCINGATQQIKHLVENDPNLKLEFIRLNQDEYLVSVNRDLDKSFIELKWKFIIYYQTTGRVLYRAMFGKLPALETPDWVLNG